MANKNMVNRNTANNIANKKKSLFLFLILACLCLPSLADPAPQALDPGTTYLNNQNNSYPIQKTLRYLSNSNGHTHWPQVQLQPAQQWSKNSKTTPNFSRGAYWFTFKIKNLNAEHQQWILEIANTRLNLIDVYYVQDGIAQLSWLSGESRPLSLRPIQHRTPLFPMHLKAGESIQVYIHAQNDSTLQLPLTLWERSTYRVKDQSYTLFWGICIGLVTIMIIYNALMYSVIHDRSYLFYSGYAICTLFFLITYQGIGYQFIWPNLGYASPFMTRIAAISTGIFLALFVIELLDIKRHSTNIYRTYIAIIIVHIGLLILLFTPYHTDIALAVISQLIALLVLCTGIFRWTQGDPVARNFTLAWTSVFIGVLIHVFSVRLRLIPVTFITMHAITIGVIVEVALQSLVLNARFNSLRAKRYHMQASAATKKHFLANITREMRSPLNAIVSYARFNHERHKNLTITAPPDLPSICNDGIDNDYLLRIKTASQNLLSIINDILYLSGNESIDITLKNTDFNIYHVFAEQSDMFACNLLGKNINIIFIVDRDISTVLNGDPPRLSQVLTILVNNAIKHTIKGEITIRVKHSATPRVNEAMLEFIVTDTGVGISAEKSAMIMTLLNERAQHSTGADIHLANTDGSHRPRQEALTRTSLRGLDVCSKLVGIMGGSMHLDTTLDQGCAFHFTARFRRPSQANPPGIHDELYLPNTFRQKSRILVIEKNLTLHAYLKNIFDLMGINTQHCTFLQKYQPQHLTNNTYDLIIIEADMPLANKSQRTACLQTIRQIKQIHQHQAPIILMSQIDQHALLKEASALGVNMFINKPINPFALRQRMLASWGYTESCLDEGRDAEPKNRKLKNIQSPFATPPSPDEKKTGNKITEHLGGASVLLVEDNALNREFAFALLNSAKLHVTCASNGREAVDKVLSTHFDAVLMDIQMPIMDGLRATRLIRSDPQFSLLPIIAVTAGILQNEQDKCFEAGMDDLISKPIDSALLFDALKRCIPPRAPIVNISQRYSQLNSQLSSQHSSQESAQLDELENETHKITDAQKPTNITPITASQLPKKLPGINLEEGLARTQNDIKLFSYLLDGFYKDNACAADRIRQALANGSTQTAHRELHTIKGLSASIGAHRLAEITKRCDASIISTEPPLAETSRPDSPTPSHVLSEALASQLHQFEVALMEVCASAQCVNLFTNKQSHKTPDSEPEALSPNSHNNNQKTANNATNTLEQKQADRQYINEKLHVLSQQIKNNDLGAINTIEAIQKNTARIPELPELQELEKHIFSLKFTEAEDCLDRVLHSDFFIDLN